MKDILNKKGLRWTRQRQEIYNELKNETAHYTAEDILTKLRKKGIDTGLSTIYRTLQLLEENGLVKRLPIGRETAVYESCDKTDHGHHHMHCGKCGRMIEIHVDMLDDIEKLITKKYGFKVTGHTVLFTGLCPDCIEEGKLDEG
jgi:Fur family ferric uptake transcriptional regulator